MADSKLVSEVALSALASDIKAALELKANQATTYTKTETDNLLADKADKSDTYTKEEVDNEVYNVLPTDTASGSIAHFTDGADNIPVKSLASEIVAVESGSGEKSPDNPYTISGFDSGVVSVCGINLWDEQWELGLYNSSTGEPFESNNYLRSKTSNYILVSPNTNYFICSPKIIRIFEYDSNYQFIKYTDRLNNILLVSENCKYIRFCVYDSSYGTTYNNDISINYPSTDTQYHAYNGNTYTFAFGQTVYGGYFDNKGNLVVTHKIVDFGDLGYYYSNGRFSSTDIPDVKNVSVWNLALKLCSCYDITEVQLWTQGDSIIGLYGKNIYIKDSRYTDTTSFKQALTGQKFTVELANPITLAITSQDIPTLLGENNIISNCGDVEVNYHADIGLYIDKKISSLAQA